MNDYFTQIRIKERYCLVSDFTILNSFFCIDKSCDHFAIVLFLQNFAFHAKFCKNQTFARICKFTVFKETVLCLSDETVKILHETFICKTV